MDQLKEALESAGIKIVKYDPSKQKSVDSSVGKMEVRKFSKVLLEKLGANMAKFPEIIKAAYDPTLMEKALENYSSGAGSLVSGDEDSGVDILPEFADLTLNLDLTAKNKEEAFFVTTPDELESRTSGWVYINCCKIPPAVAPLMARRLIREYHPHTEDRVFDTVNPQTKEQEKIYNTHTPPDWKRWKKDNEVAWRKLPSKPPKLFMELLKHLIPDKIERQYLYAWLYTSITSRSYVYLVLCGAPGVGKNRLRHIVCALHGYSNTVAGKHSTIKEKFNSQLSGGTLAWFDELKYDSDMENVMKEIQNDFISIERKGVDATRSSKIYTSMAISNNKPRDNFIAFDARKFAPLMLAPVDLKARMTSDEIDLLSRKTEESSPDFDVKYVAQIAKWILSIGKHNIGKWPNLEYRGPMFWTLAHTSMTRWQKRAITALVDKKTGSKVGWDQVEMAHLWSKVEEKLAKRSGDHTGHFPDYSSVKAFFDIFRDGEGKKAFDTKLVPGNNILGDFWIYPLLAGPVHIITDATVAMQREKGKQNDKKETFDL